MREMTDRYQEENGRMVLKNRKLMFNKGVKDVSTAKIEWGRVQMNSSTNGNFSNEISFQIPPASNKFIDRTSIFMEVTGQILYQGTTSLPAGKLEFNTPAVSPCNGFSDAIFSSIDIYANSTLVSDSVARYGSTCSFIRKLMHRDRNCFRGSGITKTATFALDNVLPYNQADIASAAPTFQCSYTNSASTNPTNYVGMDPFIVSSYTNVDPGLNGSEMYYMLSPVNMQDAVAPMTTYQSNAPVGNVAYQMLNQTYIGAETTFPYTMAQYNTQIAGVNYDGESSTNLIPADCISRGTVLGYPNVRTPDNLCSIYNETIMALQCPTYTSNGGYNGPGKGGSGDNSLTLTSKPFTTIVRPGQGFTMDDDMISTLCPPGTSIELRCMQNNDSFRLKCPLYEDATGSSDYSYQIQAITVWYKYYVPTELCMSAFTELFISNPFIHNIMRGRLVSRTIVPGQSILNDSNVYSGPRPFMAILALPTATSQAGSITEQFTSFGPYSKNAINTIPVVRQIALTWNDDRGNSYQFPRTVLTTPNNEIPIDDGSAVQSDLLSDQGCDPYLQTRAYMMYLECHRQASLNGDSAPSLSFNEWAAFYTIYCFNMAKNSDEKFGESLQSQEVGSLSLFVQMDRPVASYNGSTGTIVAPNQFNPTVYPGDFGHSNSPILAQLYLLGQSTIEYHSDSGVQCSRVVIKGF